MSANKCPKCEKAITEVRLNRIQATFSHGRGTMLCFAYVCPLCETILGVGPDPSAVEKDLLQRIDELLQDHTRTLQGGL